MSEKSEVEGDPVNLPVGEAERDRLVKARLLRRNQRWWERHGDGVHVGE